MDAVAGLRAASPHPLRQIAGRLTQNPFSSANAVTFSLWLAIVAVLSVRHQVWRDEMRALSIAASGDTLPAMFAVLHGEGHPLAWYLILRLAYVMVHATLVLKLASLAVAAAAALLILTRSPFPHHLKALFLFSPLMLFEYSVLSRNYGISVVVMFLLATVLAGGARRPVLTGALLFLLANTNVHSVVLAAGYMVVLLGDWYAGPRSPAGFARTVALPGVFALAGAVVCFLTVWPAKHDLAAQYFVHGTLTQSLLNVVVSPGLFFEDVLPTGFLVKLGIPFDGLAGTILLYLTVAGLVRRPALLIAGLAAIFGLSLVFSFGYPGSARHEGLLVAYILSLYWIGIGRGDAALPRSLSFKYVIPISLFLMICIGTPFVAIQLVKPYSMSGRVGALLNGDPVLRQAIVISDLDYNVEALSYYADNVTYLVRESRYGKVPVFTAHAKLDLSLAELLEAARNLRAESGKPIVILVSAPLAETGTETLTRTIYGWIFRYDDNEIREFRAATREIAALRGAETEDYDVYLLN